MKLVSLWVENYMLIVNQGFNFGSRFTYSFDFNPEKYELTVRATDTVDYFDLFQNSGITNITGLIGPNGSGKTSLIKLINVIDARKPLTHSVVFVIEDDRNNKLKIIVYNDGIFRLTKKNVKVNFETNGRLQNGFFERDSVVVSDSNSPLGEFDVMYFSNLYSAEQNDRFLGTSNHLNRSVTYRTGQSLHYSRIQRYLKKYEKNLKEKMLQTEESFHILRLYEIDRLKLLIQFLAGVNSDHQALRAIIKDVKFPQLVKIWFSNDIYSSRAEGISKNSNFDFDSLSKIHVYCLQTNEILSNRKVKLRNEVIFKIFMFCFYSQGFSRLSPSNMLDLESFVKGVQLDENVFDNLHEYLLSSSTLKTIAGVSQITSFLTNLDQIIENLEVIEPASFIDERTFDIRITEKLWGFLYNLISFSEFENENLVEFSITPLSAGESALLNQFSEFYEALKHVKKTDVLVTIDEGELYLHPEWQRQYINSLHLFFGYFSDQLKAKFQLAVTSHSPFIVSDIPRFNLIFLKRDDAGLSKNSDSVQHLQTLGGNVFELFVDGFYLEEFISAFAFKKIDAAIKFLNGEEQTDFKNIAEVDAFSKLIGESIVRDEIQKIIDREKSKDFDKYFEIVREGREIEVPHPPKPKKNRTRKTKKRK